MIKIQDQKSTPLQILLEIKSGKRGVNKLLQEARVRADEAVEAINLMQVEDGLWKNKWGANYYGEATASEMDGATEYLKSDLTTQLIVIAGGKFWKCTDGGAWTEVTGLGFTAGIQCYFMQIGGYLYIANGTDPLTRYNGTALSTYSEISAPTGLTASRIGSSIDGSFTIYGEVTALNSIGETVGSTEFSITINKERDQWDTTLNEGLHWSWGAVSGATRYQLYISDQSGNEALVASSTETFFIDNGTLVINPYITPPLSNTTAAPKFTSMIVSGNRIWATKDPNNPYTVYFSGTGTYIGIFSDFYGGGWINLEKGGREVPQKVIHYQTGGGTGVPTVLCKTPEGRGSIWQISIDSLTVGSTTFSVPSANKIIGSFGTEALGSVVSTTKNFMFFNRKGVFQTGPKQNFYGILVTEEMSVNIRPYIRSLTGSAVPNVSGYFYDGKVFFAVPNGSSTNNNIIIWDTERQNWSVYWTNSAKQFLEYTDSDGVTHFLYIPVGGSRLAELNENFEGDFGSAYSTSYVSGRLSARKFWNQFAKVDKAYVKLGNPKGTINFEVSGTGKNKTFLSLGTRTINSGVSNTGLGWDPIGTVKVGDTLGTPTFFSDSALKKYIKIRQLLNDVQFRISSSVYGVQYTIQGFLLEGRTRNTRPPNIWKN